MKTIPCVRCGYHAPAQDCPHCGEATELAARAGLGRLAKNPLEEMWVGAMALPRGLVLLFTTPRIKRWLVPPLFLTLAVLVGALAWMFHFFDGVIEAHSPGEFTIQGTWAWLDSREGWDLAKSSWGGLIAAAEWVVNFFLGLLLSKPLKLLGWFLLGSLASWYTFSIAYEAIAGPFLDEIQARLEARWFGSDPRTRLERPNDIPADRCLHLSLLSSALASLALTAIFLIPAFSAWLLLPALALSVVPAIAIDRRFGPWLRWVASVEWRAAWASLQASMITAIMLLFAFPLYFVPGVGYLLFALVAGFGAAVGLLDIPLERRGWSFGQRVWFILSHLHCMLVFGMAAGLLLAIPVFGPLIMVPAASLGGQWMVCRLDKSELRERSIRKTG